MTYQSHKARTKEIKYFINDNGCYICTSHSKNPKGYPQIQRYKKKDVLSRYVYTQHYGEIPQGMVVRHKCDEPSCINIDHLELGTQKENMEDMVERGRSLKGVNYKGGVSIPKLKELRLAKGYPQWKLAQLVGCTQSAVSRLENGDCCATPELADKITRRLS